MDQAWSFSSSERGRGRYGDVRVADEIAGHQGRGRSMTQRPCRLYRRARADLCVMGDAGRKAGVREDALYL